jgi:hypothetical protein
MGRLSVCFARMHAHQLLKIGYPRSSCQMGLGEIFKYAGDSRSMWSIWRSLRVAYPLSKPGKQVRTEIETTRTVAFLAPGMETGRRRASKFCTFYCPWERKVNCSFDCVLARRDGERFCVKTAGCVALRLWTVAISRIFTTCFCRKRRRPGQNNKSPRSKRKKKCMVQPCSPEMLHKL